MWQALPRLPEGGLGGLTEREGSSSQRTGEVVMMHGSKVHFESTRILHVFSLFIVGDRIHMQLNVCTLHGVVLDSLPLQLNATSREDRPLLIT